MSTGLSCCVRAKAGEKRRVALLPIAHDKTGAKYWAVSCNPKLSVLPRPPYTSAPAAKFSRQNRQFLPEAKVARGREIPIAYPNSSPSDGEKFFAIMKFSAMLQSR